jgi:hypothetical protein
MLETSTKNYVAYPNHVSPCCRFLLASITACPPVFEGGVLEALQKPPRQLFFPAHPSPRRRTLSPRSSRSTCFSSLTCTSRCFMSYLHFSQYAWTSRSPLGSADAPLPGKKTPRPHKLFHPAQQWIFFMPRPPPPVVVSKRPHPSYRPSPRDT